MHTALILDIAGTVCPTSGSSPFGELVEVGVALQPVRVAPSLCAALTDLGALPEVTPVWLTSWLPRTRQAMRPPFPGRDWDQIDLSAGAEARDGWPKWPALGAWLARNPRITHVAWVDDELGQPMAPHPGDRSSAPRRAEFYTAELDRRGIRALLLIPATADGMAPHHIAHLSRWLGSDHGVPAPGVSRCVDRATPSRPCRPPR